MTYFPDGPTVAVSLNAQFAHYVAQAARVGLEAMMDTENMIAGLSGAFCTFCIGSEQSTLEAASSELESSFDTVDSNLTREYDDYAHSAEDARDQSAALMNDTAPVAEGPILMADSAATAEAIARVQEEMRVMEEMPAIPTMNEAPAVSVTQDEQVAEAESQPHSISTVVVLC